MIQPSDEDIYAAADAVLACGRSATAERVRAHLGCGDPQRIGALLDRWWICLLDRLQRNTLPAPINHALSMLWEQATAQGRQEAEQAFSAQRQVGVEKAHNMEKSFAKRRQQLEGLLAKERRVFTNQRQRLLDRNERLREQLRQSRTIIKEAKVAVRFAEQELNKMQRHLGLYEVIDAQRRRHAHKQTLEFDAMTQELCRLFTYGADPSAISASASASASATKDADCNLWRDFAPLLEAAQHRLTPWLDELRRQLSVAPVQALEPDDYQRARSFAQAQVLKQLLDELRLQAVGYSAAVDELFFQLMPLYLQARQTLKD
ncbi:DNA-binding protein [Pseudomonas sp. NPDC087690]|uniref:DNA-binding protein n=1 Tax=Pseudomonas sp. NPDC087690 TaxID=3364446 RepID=UPI0038002C76